MLEKDHQQLLAREAGEPALEVLDVVADADQTLARSLVERREAALDERLNEDGYILPGLGDAGDRLFGTR